jgi:hypothetical protein
MSAPRRPRAGWSRTKVAITPEMLVLDLGSGAFPNPRADLLCDRELVDNRHRAGLPIVVDRPTVVADATALPFRSQAVDFVIVSHLAEHIVEPDPFCAELARVAAAGYIETPSPLADVLLHEDYHLWRVGNDGGTIVFGAKPPRGRWRSWWTDAFYRVFYAGETCERRTYSLPRGPLGKVAGRVLWLVGGVLNRSGVMHTRVHFDPTRPLRWRVDDR